MEYCERCKIFVPSEGRTVLCCPRCGDDLLSGSSQHSEKAEVEAVSEAKLLYRYKGDYFFLG